VPSLRINEQLRAIGDVLTTDRHSGLTLAPEAARDEMRHRIGKPIRNEDLYEGCREAFKNVPVVIGGIEASLRRIAHYDYWSDTMRRSVLADSKADMLLFGNAERALVELTHRLAADEEIGDIRDLRGSAFMAPSGWKPSEDWIEVDSLAVAAGSTPVHFVRPPSPASGGGAGGEGVLPAPPRLIPADILTFARELRTQQTDAEQLVWNLVRAKRFLGLKFRRQHPVGRYILDFYCDEKKLAIELDGGQHAEQAGYDNARSEFLASQGIKVLRFWNNEVLGQTESVLEAIYQAVLPSPGPSGHPLPLPSPGASHHPLPLAGEGNMLPSPASGGGAGGEGNSPGSEIRALRAEQRMHTVLRLPSFEQVEKNSVLDTHASRVFHLESNPGNARAMVQAHGERDVWLNPPPIPLTTPEMDHVYGLPYARAPHPSYGDAKIPAWEMIRFSINIMRGCFGGCTFCSITEHEGRIIQSRSEGSILREIEDIRDKTPGFTGIVSDLGGPTANMYRLACKDPKIESACRRLSCVFPDICENLGTDHGPLVQLYRKARAIPGVKKILIGSGVRYDLAVKSPEYVKELVTHHVGGYLKIAPEHTEEGPLEHMMKPKMTAYDKFKQLFEKFSREAGKEQYLIPYFIAAHPGTTDEDMLNLALWLKRNGFRLDQVQTFLPTPLALATTMWRTELNPLKPVLGGKARKVPVTRGERARRLQKAFLRYHDPDNWPMLREALKDMGRADLIGNGKQHLIPAFQPAGNGRSGAGRPGTKGGGRPQAGPGRGRPVRRG